MQNLESFTIKNQTFHGGARKGAGRKPFDITNAEQKQVKAMQEQLNRIEAKLDLLIQALAQELEQEDDSQPIDLNGNTYGRERDDTQPL